MGRKKHPNRYKTLYILRGLPGTGKTRKARQLQMTQGGVIISADDFFRDDSGEIKRKDSQLHISHVWARKKALEAMDNEEDPVIIDNTNMACWEMFPYVIMGYRRFYWIKFIVMKDTWRVSLDELYKRCKGEVPFKKLEHMKRSYQRVRHIFDVLRDERAQNWWSNPEMIDNGWDRYMTDSENSDSDSNSDRDNYSDS